MDLSILLRLGPSVLAAVAMAVRVDAEGQVVPEGHAAPERRIRPGEAFDEVVRALVVGLVAGRVAWLALGGPEVWRSALGTAVLVRAGVETGVGVLVAAWWVARRDDGWRNWRARAAVPTALAGLATWHGLCQVEGVCGGRPVSWGVMLPGRAVATFPAGYVEAAGALALLALAWRWRRDVRRLWFLAAAYALLRVGLGFARPVLVAHPTRDQLLFAAVAVGAVVVARRADP